MTCTHPHSKTLETRHTSFGIRRRRLCPSCNLRYTTLEVQFPARFLRKYAKRIASFFQELRNDPL